MFSLCFFERKVLAHSNSRSKTELTYRIEEVELMAPLEPLYSWKRVFWIKKWNKSVLTNKTLRPTILRRIINARLIRHFQSVRQKWRKKSQKKDGKATGSLDHTAVCQSTSHTYHSFFSVRLESLNLDLVVKRPCGHLFVLRSNWARNKFEPNSGR